MFATDFNADYKRWDFLKNKFWIDVKKIWTTSRDCLSLNFVQFNHLIKIYADNVWHGDDKYSFFPYFSAFFVVLFIHNFRKKVSRAAAAVHIHKYCQIYKQAQNKCLNTSLFSCVSCVCFVSLIHSFFFVLFAISCIKYLFMWIKLRP